MSPSAKKTTRKAAPPAPSLNMYRRIAVGFVVAVALMLGAVLFVSSVSATIRVTPVKSTLKTEFLADVVKTPTKDTEVRGAVVAATVGKSGSYAPSGQGTKQVEAKSAGTVVIHNTSSKAQPLVATTRLLTADGVLFRIDADVNVPAGGSVETTAHADVAGATGDIPPSRFTIPGLSESLQKLIYADSSQPFAGGVTTISVVSQQDIDQSALALRNELEEQAKAALRAEAGETFSGEAFSFEITEQTSDVAAGAEASVVTLTMSVKATAVFFDKDALKGIAARKLYAELQPGQEFAALNPDAVQASVDKADPQTGLANVHVYLDGEATVSAASKSLDPGRFSGLSAADVKQLLVKEGVATDVSVSFSPFWITRVPQLKDHVNVEIK